jgi:antitoxin component of MazEF toxin-antitoxin module
MAAAKIEKDGERRLVVLPPELLSQLGWDEGDVLAAEISNGGVKFTRVRTADNDAMEIAEGIMDEYRETLEALARS